MPVTGVGGVFFRAKDPEGLRAWYRTHLGVGGEGYAPWQTAAGPLVFMPFKASTDYWPDDKQWMLNLRVSGIDALIASLKEAGIAVKTDPSWDSPDTGRFAHIDDPEGNRIELWEPPAK